MSSVFVTSPVSTDMPLLFQSFRSGPFVATVFCDVKRVTWRKFGLANRIDLVMYWPMVPVPPNMRMLEAAKADMAP